MRINSVLIFGFLIMILSAGAMAKAGSQGLDRGIAHGQNAMQNISDKQPSGMNQSPAAQNAVRGGSNDGTPPFGGNQSQARDRVLVQHRSSPAQEIQKRFQLSNGRNISIKVMPETASQRAIERLRLRVCSPENNCTIELREVGQGNQSQAAYEIRARKQAKLFGLIQTQMRVQAHVDAENGQVIRVQKPWWAFLATE